MADLQQTLWDILNVSCANFKLLKLQRFEKRHLTLPSPLTPYRPPPAHIDPLTHINLKSAFYFKVSRLKSSIILAIKEIKFKLNDFKSNYVYITRNVSTHPMALNILLTMQRISQGNQQTCCHLLQKRVNATSLEGLFPRGTAMESYTTPPLHLDLMAPCLLNTERSAMTNECYTSILRRPQCNKQYSSPHQ